MLNEQQTLNKYGYTVQSLSEGSGKKIVLSCDYCQETIEKPYKARIIQNKELDKDCCSKCKFKKREELSLLKYGVKNSAQRQDVKEKLCDYNIEDYKEQIIDLLSQNYSITNISEKINIPSTSLNRYLSLWGYDTKGDLQQKKEKTFQEKYGDDYKQIFKDKRTQTNLERYGCENPFQNDEIKNKITETMKTKYGYDHHMKDAVKQKQARQTNLDKYGYDNVAKVPDFKEKIKQTNLAKYGFEQATKNPEVKSKILATMVENGNAKLYEGLDSKTWAEKTGYCLSRFNQLIREYGFEVAKTMYRTDGYSSLENRFRSFLEEYNIEYSQQHRVYDNDKKYYIADFKLGSDLLIECDGLYWHSELAREDHKYHIYKQETYAKNNYNSLFFREDELKDRFEIVKSVVLNKLGKSNRIYARECDVDILNDRDGDLFFNNNHLMGKGRGSTYVLRYKDEVVSALRLKRLKNKDYEISRFCNLNFTSVVGGFSKLLKAAIKDKTPDSVITFIDKRYGKGEYLSGLGFQYVHSYPSFRWTDGLETFHRLKFPGNSGYEKGLFKLWDCGQAKWILKM